MATKAYLPKESRRFSKCPLMFKTNNSTSISIILYFVFEVNFYQATWIYCERKISMPFESMQNNFTFFANL